MNPTIQPGSSLVQAPADDFMQCAFSPTGNAAQNERRQVLSGRYSEVQIEGSRIIKINSVEVAQGTHSLAEEVQRRVAETRLYLDCLNKAGVSCPEMSVDPGALIGRANSIVIQAEYLRAPHNLIQVGIAPFPEKLQLIDGMFVELQKLISTQYSSQALGYDSGFDNFVSKDGRCYLVDIYPPRLGFVLNAAAAPSAMPFEQLLINYPEKENLTPERQAQMRRYYYTPQGSVEHFATWAISLLYAQEAHSPWELRREDPRTMELVNLLQARLCNSGRQPLAAHLEEYLQGPAAQAEMQHRLKRSPERLAIALKQWEDTCR